MGKHYKKGKCEYKNCDIWSAPGENVTDEEWDAIFADKGNADPAEENAEVDVD